MIDYFALALCHALLLLMLWRIQQRPDLDREEWLEQGAPEVGADKGAADDKLPEGEQRRARRRGRSAQKPGQQKQGDGGNA